MRSWWEAHPAIPGAAAVLEEAFRLGAKIFGGLLRDSLPGWPRPGPGART
ncbi:MAG: hypothetical protein HYY64_03360 [Candidatus Rokubacteria bacterium]|nr:hypothetical protein [Candidatus Rokubacteria bacterium]